MMTSTTNSYAAKLSEDNGRAKKRKMQPADDENPPADDGNSPADDENPPGDDGNPPAGAENPPADDGNSPAGDGNSPAGDENPPADDGNSPADDGNPPADDGNSPAGDENTPADDENPPADDENPLADDENPPAGGENPPADDENPPADDENPPADDENPPADHENLLADVENPPADAENPPADGENLPADDEKSPADDENPPAYDENLLADVENPPADDENLPADDENPPADDDNPPADDENLPADEKNPPADDENLLANDQQSAADDEQNPVTDDQTDEKKNLLGNDKNIPPDHQQLAACDEKLPTDQKLHANDVVKVTVDNEKMTTGDQENPSTSDCAKNPPTDADIKSYVMELLGAADLEETTPRSIIQQVYQHYPEFDLRHKRPFIRNTVMWWLDEFIIKPRQKARSDDNIRDDDDDGDDDEDDDDSDASSDEETDAPAEDENNQPTNDAKETDNEVKENAINIEPKIPPIDEMLTVSKVSETTAKDEVTDTSTNAQVNETSTDEIEKPIDIEIQKLTNAETNGETNNTSNSETNETYNAQNNETLGTENNKTCSSEINDRPIKSETKDITVAYENDTLYAESSETLNLENNNVETIVIPNETFSSHLAIETKENTSKAKAKENEADEIKNDIDDEKMSVKKEKIETPSTADIKKPSKEEPKEDETKKSKKKKTKLSPPDDLTMRPPNDEELKLYIKIAMKMVIKRVFSYYSERELSLKRDLIASTFISCINDEVHKIEPIETMEPNDAKSNTPNNYEMCSTLTDNVFKATPTDLDIEQYVKQLLEGVAVEQTTPKMVLDQVLAHYYPGFVLAHKREFIEGTIYSFLNDATETKTAPTDVESMVPKEEKNPSMEDQSTSSTDVKTEGTNIPPTDDIVNTPYVENTMTLSNTKPIFVFSANRGNTNTAPVDVEVDEPMENNINPPTNDSADASHTGATSKLQPTVNKPLFMFSADEVNTSDVGVNTYAENTITPSDVKTIEPTDPPSADSLAASASASKFVFKELPSDEELKQFIVSTLQSSDLTQITMKTVIRQVSDHYREYFLTHRRDFLKATITAWLNEEA